MSQEHIRSHSSIARSCPAVTRPASGRLERSGILGTIFLAIACIVGCSGSAVEVAPPKSDAPAGTVTVVIATEDGGEIRKEIAGVASGTTIAQIMRSIDDPEIKTRGSGSTTFVESIGGIGTAEGKGWTFRVNGEWADRGVGDYTLEPPAEVRWTHGSFQEKAEEP
ncbi:MAG: hypothetical protein RI963_1307 [Planctomycetota bacterium]